VSGNLGGTSTTGAGVEGSVSMGSTGGFLVEAAVCVAAVMKVAVVVVAVVSLEVVGAVAARGRVDDAVCAGCSTPATAPPAAAPAAATVPNMNTCCALSL